VAHLLTGRGRLRAGWSCAPYVKTSGRAAAHPRPGAIHAAARPTRTPTTFARDSCRGRVEAEHPGLATDEWRRRSGGGRARRPTPENGTARPDCLRLLGRTEPGSASLHALHCGELGKKVRPREFGHARTLGGAPWRSRRTCFRAPCCRAGRRFGACPAGPLRVRGVSSFGFRRSFQTARRGKGARRALGGAGGGKRRLALREGTVVFGSGAPKPGSWRKSSSAGRGGGRGTAKGGRTGAGWAGLHSEEGVGAAELRPMGRLARQP